MPTFRGFFLLIPTKSRWLNIYFFSLVRGQTSMLFWLVPFTSTVSIYAAAGHIHMAECAVYSENSPMLHGKSYSKLWTKVLNVYSKSSLFQDVSIWTSYSSFYELDQNDVFLCTQDETTWSEKSVTGVCSTGGISIFRRAFFRVLCSPSRIILSVTRTHGHGHISKHVGTTSKNHVIFW